MTVAPIPVWIAGQGMAAKALLSALGIVRQGFPEMGFDTPCCLVRGASLPKVQGRSLCLIANPHSLHAQLVLDAEAKGFSHIVCEKPVAVSLDLIDRLKEVKADVVVCHGYRQNWGPQRIHQAVAAGELGRIVSVEGRYWQSSAAAQALSRTPPREHWKNNPALSGPFDTLLDLGTHWADLVSFVLGSRPERTRGWVSYLNAESPHRDTHVHLEMDFENGVRSFGSVSKTAHGNGNHLELVVIGTEALMKWNFERPDELILGRGKELRTLSRSSQEPVSSGLPAYHALGWMEGYVAILHAVVRRMRGETVSGVPTLAESLSLTETLLRTDFVRQH